MVSLAERSAIAPTSRLAFGNLAVTFRKDRNFLSMLEASETEWDVIDDAIRKALGNLSGPVSGRVW